MVMMRAARRCGVLALVLLLSACGQPPTPQSVATTLPPTTMPTPILPPTAIPPTPTSEPLPVRPADTIDLGDGRWIATHSFVEQNQTLSYTLQAQWPVIEGVITPQIEQFNLAAHKA